MERPTGVTILAVLSFVGAAFAALGALGLFLAGAIGLGRMGGQAAALGGIVAMFGAVAGAIMLVLAVLYLVVGVGLWRLRGWGRIITIVLVGLGMLFALAGAAKALMPIQVGILIWQTMVVAIDAWILTYLFKPQIKQAFGA